MDYYTLPDGRIVFTEEYLLKRGYCCKEGCLHCPYDFHENRVESQGDPFQSIQCPTCFETFQISVYPEEGQKQTLVYDCEVCCRPILVEIRFSGTTPSISTHLLSE